MKTQMTLMALAFVFVAFAGNPITEERKSEKEIVCSIEHRTMPSLIEGQNADSYFRTKLVQPTEVNELPNGTMPLSEDLPYVHTIRGAVYTADHLRYIVR